MKKKWMFLLLCMTLLLLAACGGESGKGKPEAAADNPGDVYRVVVKDEAGNPVQGVMVQLCSDQACTMGETDADGIASYPDSPEGSYHVKVYSVPEGFAEDTTEYPVPETYGDVDITLKTAE